MNTWAEWFAEQRVVREDSGLQRTLRPRPTTTSSTSPTTTTWG